MIEGLQLLMGLVAGILFGAKLWREDALEGKATAHKLWRYQMRFLSLTDGAAMSRHMQGSSRRTCFSFVPRQRTLTATQQPDAPSCVLRLHWLPREPHNGPS